MQISSSRTRITPEGPFFPCYLLGHAIRTEKALGVADDLWASALVLKVEETTLIWVSVDLAGLSKMEKRPSSQRACPPVFRCEGSRHDQLHPHPFRTRI